MNNEMQFTVYETNGTVTSMCCIVEPDNIDVNNIIKAYEIYPHFVALNDKPCVAFYNPNAKLSDINYNATKKYSEQFQARFGHLPKGLLYGTIAVLTAPDEVLNKFY